jgi:hypothetical protein
MMSDAAAAEGGNLIGGAPPAEGEPKPDATPPAADPPAADPPAAADPPKPDDPPAPEEGKGDPPAEPVVPEKYDLKLPDGVTLDENLVEIATPLFKENKWSNEIANQAVGVFAKVQQSQAAAFEDMKANNDAELRKSLGDDYGPTQNRVTSLIEAFKAQVGEQDATELVETIVDLHGLGSNPVMVKFLDWMAKGLNTEDSASVNAMGGKPDPKETRAAKLKEKYPTMFDDDGKPKS